MMAAITTLAYVYLVVSGLYFGYAGVMNFKRGLADGTLPCWVVLLVGLWAIGFYVLDVLVNWCFMTVLFLELPQEATVSNRLSRLELTTGWRSTLAHAICRLLDPLDPSGEHCI